jgi:type IV pilus assembly protein PilE
MQRTKGFTLIELMIVVGIIGAILVFALPSYVEQMKKSRRNDAKTVLVTLAQLQESFYIDNGNRYAANLVGDASLNCHTKGICVKSGDGAISVEGYYQLGIEAGSTGNLATSFLIKATALAGGAQKNDSKCKVFSIDSRGRKLSYDASNTASEHCW